MNAIPFYKMSGSGNDFIIIDNRTPVVPEDRIVDFIVQVCRRKMSVGSDGLILLEDTEGADFKWRFYNSDGSDAEMCGNGARCAARFAYLNKIAEADMSFETVAGMVHAEVRGNRVKINLPDPFDLKADETVGLESGMLTVSSINTGVPHVVVPVEDLERADVANMGREIRFHTQYAPAGTNVNFIQVLEEDSIAIRTYERGVEDETLACGTGAVASAIISAIKFGRQSPVDVLTRSGGQLKIYFAVENDVFRDIFLEGDARVIYAGELWEDAWAE